MSAFKVAMHVALLIVLILASCKRTTEKRPPAPASTSIESSGQLMVEDAPVSQETLPWQEITLVQGPKWEIRLAARPVHPFLAEYDYKIIAQETVTAEVREFPLPPNTGGQMHIDVYLHDGKLVMNSKQDPRTIYKVELEEPKAILQGEWENWRPGEDDPTQFPPIAGGPSAKVPDSSFRLGTLKDTEHGLRFEAAEPKCKLPLRLPGSSTCPATSQPQQPEHNENQ